MVIALSTQNVRAEEKKVCRALSLKGGGSKGAYEVGVFKGLLENLDPKEVEYDVVVGASIGAFNAAQIALFAPGDEKSALAYLEEYWLDHSIQDYWEFWGTSFLAGFYKTSFLDDSKLLEMLHQRFDHRDFKRELSYHAVDIKTGAVVIFNEKVPIEYRALSLKASGSIPGFAPPAQIGSFTLVDGGVYDSLDLSEAILKCQNKGFKDEDIVIDIVLCFGTPVKVEEWLMKQTKLLSTF